jgi:hypothetical protein
MNEYVRVVDEVKGGLIPCGSGCKGQFDVLKERHRELNVRLLLVARCDDGNVAVAFLLDTDVPLLHEGYVFEGYREDGHCGSEALRLARNWPYVRHVSGPWYHFSDEPGL